LLTKLKNLEQELMNTIAVNDPIFNSGAFSNSDMDTKMSNQQQQQQQTSSGNGMHSGHKNISLGKSNQNDQKDSKQQNQENI
jgi:hypothetical protein